MKEPAMKRNLAVECVVFALLIVLASLGRLLAHTPNFTPVAAAALFAGMFFRRRLVAAAVPVIGMIISDLFIGFYPLMIMLTVYAATVFPIYLRKFVASSSAWRVGLSAAASSAVFFLSTNFAVWASGGGYARDLDGLVRCYTAAFAFLKYTLAGDLFWSAVIFGAYGLATYLVGSVTPASANPFFLSRQLSHLPQARP
jgi:hypothetical protein